MSTTPLSTDAPEDRGSEQSLEQKAIAGLSQGQLVRRRFFRHRGAMIALMVLFLTIVFAFSSVGTVIGSGALSATSEGTLRLSGWRIPGWWDKDWYTAYPIVNGGQPTMSLVPFAIGEHPFGQDTLGKDVFAQVMRGAQQSITVMFLVGAVSLVLGVVVGALSGFFRGWVDSVLMRMTDVVIIIPIIVIGSIIGKLLGGSPAWVFGLFLGILSWTGLARLVRGEFLALREREFVDAARVAGASNSRIIFRHILPNAVGVIIVNTTLLMSAAVLIEAALSFIGFGITYPDVSLGQIISEYREAFRTRPWLFWWPGFFIIILALCINFIGDGLRDAFDPRQQSKVSKRKAAKAVAAVPSVQPGSVLVSETSADDPRGVASDAPPAARRGKDDQA
ncbi:ABC transporter permease [Microbacterium sp. bgisy189]|uniref:ABC transporter permease n=1 Tax=Microbacterium sp. bgisy189 TaxID=3413798 RepID=UPI003EBA95E4